MSRKVDLVLGDGDFAEACVDLSIDTGHRIIFGRTHLTTLASSENLTVKRLDSSSYDSFVDLFHDAITTHGHIDDIILAFPPSHVLLSVNVAVYNSGKDIEGYTGFQEVLWPVIKAVKVALYHWRRDFRVGIIKRLGIVSYEDNAMIGFYRGMLPRLELLGIRGQLIIVPHAGHTLTSGTMQSLIQSAAVAPKSRITYVSKGDILCQPVQWGSCNSPSNEVLRPRLMFFMRISESVVAYRIWKKTAYGKGVMLMLKAIIGLGLGVTMVSAGKNAWSGIGLVSSFVLVKLLATI
ncbi:hypothetical protein BCR39DRAFT_156562 [Naematelia encephala]|uniref:Uncharacterized protein n=1 Tax=Naematelia encephala TaxID=71784 RepID=A0A1Y2B796_9TREE|nr:hypothetical protein BCR39DRAFT_156562 [Naematelia encephala]